MTHFIQNLYSGTYFLKTGNTQFYKIILITAQTDISFIHSFLLLSWDKTSFIFLEPAISSENLSAWKIYFQNV